MYIYGKNVAKEYLNNNENIKKIYLSNNFSDEDILNKIKNIKVSYLDKFELDKIVKGNHQGIILEVEGFKYDDISCFDDTKLVVMLDHIEDPHNFGAIIRTCEAAGVDGIIIPKDRACEVNSTVIKVSTGAIKNIKISEVVNLNRTIQYLKDHGYWIVGTDMNGTDYKKIDYSGKTCIVIGNEGKGMSDLVKKNCDFIASIPMNGKVNSLNASVATGIIVFEAVRGNNEL
jgi:23S rRNA (guanosine2251-2'-O)-methyltransferase